MNWYIDVENVTMKANRSNLEGKPDIYGGGGEGGLEASKG